MEFLPFLQLLNNRNKLYELYISKTYKIKAKEEERKKFFLQRDEGRMASLFLILKSMYVGGFDGIFRIFSFSLSVE